MKLSVLITIITATSMVRGAALKAHGHAGADQQLHNGTRSHAGKRAPGPTCPTSGFSPPGLPDCVCNFAGGCDLGTNAPTPTANADLTNLVGIAPQGMNTFAYGTPSLGRVCEGGVVAALYDCNARISLYAATVLDGANLHGKIGRKDCWKGTTDVNLLTDPNLLAKNGDYTGSLSHKYCYEDGAGNEFEWDDSACTTTTKFKIHKGHMIAASYGEYHGNKDATFTYTNAVPQEGSFNSGKWRSAEAGMIKMHENCLNAAGKKKKDAKTYIVVGVVPSTFLGKPRFFGSAGFGNFQGISHNNGPDDFRISIPEIMWTAGCCVHTDGTIGDKFAFWRRNRYDRNDPVKTYTSATNMFAAISTEVSNTWAGITFNAPTVFPGMPGCN